MVIQRILPQQTWPLRQRVMYPNQPLSYVQIPGEEEAYHYGLYVDKQLIAVVSLFVDGTSAQFRKFATDQAYQGQGYGTSLLMHVINEAKKLNVESLWCHARLSAVGFYRRFHFQPEGKPFNKGAIEYIKMHLPLA